MNFKKGFSLVEMMVVVAIIGIVAACVLPTTGCITENTSADAVQAKLTKESLKEANKQIGMPNIVNFKQKKTLKMIYELCDKANLICYAYLKSDYTGELTLLGKCAGYGIPFSAQFTSPEKIITAYGHRFTMPQADPNALFMPTSSSATWLIMINPETQEPAVVYIEPEIVVSPFPLH